MYFPDSLKSEIQTLNSSVKRLSVQASAAMQAEEQVTKALKQHTGQQGFWDRAFGGFFGNKDRQKAIRDLEAEILRHRDEAKSHIADARAADEKADQLIDLHLSATDDNYKSLVTAHREIVQMHSTIHVLATEEHAEGASAAFERSAKKYAQSLKRLQKTDIGKISDSIADALTLKADFNLRGAPMGNMVAHEKTLEKAVKSYKYFKRLECLK